MRNLIAQLADRIKMPMPDFCRISMRDQARISADSTHPFTYRAAPDSRARPRRKLISINLI
jgi:hypothetical protein